jgi:hypothetical protein
MDTASPTAGLFGWLFPWHRARLVEQAGGEAARECRAAFWQRLAPRTAGMDVAEVRGYAHALAEGFVTANVDRVLERRRLGPSLRAEVMASAVRQLIGFAVRDALSEELSAMARPLAA